MVEKIIVNPSEVRGLGDIVSPKTSTDFTVSDDYKIVESTDTVYGTETTVYGIESAYTVSFDSASYTTPTGSLPVQVTVSKGASAVNNATVTVTGGGGGTGTGTTGLNGAANITVTGITQSGTLTANYKGATATATLTYSPVAYTLQFSQDTYTPDMFGDIIVSCTLKQNNTPMSGETITFTYGGMLGPVSVTAPTNSSGVATYQFGEFDFISLPATVTATYSGATATCTITSGGGII